MVPVLSVVGCAGHSILALLVCQPQVLKQSGPGSEPEVSCESPGWLFILPLFTYLWLPQKTICNKKGVWNLVEFKNVKTRNKSQHCFGVWALGVSRILLVFLFGFCFVYFFVFVFTDLVSNAHIKTENWQNSITGVPVRKLKLTDEWKVKGHKTGKFWRKEEKKNQTKLLIH